MVFSKVSGGAWDIDCASIVEELVELDAFCWLCTEVSSTVTASFPFDTALFEVLSKASDRAYDAVDTLSSDEFVELYACCGVGVEASSTMAAPCPVDMSVFMVLSKESDVSLKICCC